MDSFALLVFVFVNFFVQILNSLVKKVPEILKKLFGIKCILTFFYALNVFVSSLFLVKSFKGQVEHFKFITKSLHDYLCSNKAVPPA
jgi:hypothetical protein